MASQFGGLNIQHSSEGSTDCRMGETIQGCSRSASSTERRRALSNQHVTSVYLSADRGTGNREGGYKRN